MAAVNDSQKLAQYLFLALRKYKNDAEIKPYKEISNNIIFDSLEDVNHQVPLDIQSKRAIAGCTILHLALRCLQFNDVKKLIERGADITVKNGNGRTVLHEALQSHCFHSGDEIHIMRDVSEDPFVHIILSAHVDYNILKNPSNEHGLTHFHIACMTNHVKAVETFLQSGASVNEAIAINAEILSGYSPLQIAARYCASETAEVLLKHGADISHKDVKGMTALDILLQRKIKMMNYMDTEDKSAIYKKMKEDIKINENIINMLLAKSNIQDCTGLSPLQIACTMQSLSKAKLTRLLENADLHYATGLESTIWPGYTALHFAAHFNIKTVELLVQKGANILTEDAKRVTPFDLCVENYKIEDVYYLITNQQNLSNIKFSDGVTELSSFVFAMQSDSEFESFVQTISDVNIHVPFDSPLWPGYTLLHLAVVFLEKDKKILENMIEGTDYYLDDQALDERRTISVKKANNSGKKRKKVEKIKSKLCLKDIKMLLKKGSDVTAQNGLGRTPLHLAFRLQSQGLVDLLLKAHKKTANPIDDGNLSHLHIAVASGNKDLMEKLLKAHKSDVDEPVKFAFKLNVECDLDGDEKQIDVNAFSTALHIAVARGDYETTKVLVQSGADVHARDEFDLTPIHLIMCISDRYDCSYYFINAGLESIENPEDRVVESVGLSYLHVASFMDFKDIAEALLDRGANIESMITAKSPLHSPMKKFDGKRPLEVAVMSYSVNVTALLIERGAELHVGKLDGLGDGGGETVEFFELTRQSEALRQRLEREKGITLLHFACAALDVEVAKEEIDNGADVDARTHEDSPFWPGSTPLHVVASIEWSMHREEAETLVKLLLSHGAGVTSTNVQLETPIHRLRSKKVSREADYSQIIGWLLEAQRDFNVNPADRFGLSHFHIACEIDCEKVVKQFLDHGVDVNSQIDCLSFNYDGGFSPLHLAIHHSSDKSRDLLLSRREVDLTLVDCLGNTPLHCAINNCPTRFELFERMISAGADFMAANVQGVTPFEMLLDTGKTPSEMIEMMLKKVARANSFNSVTEEGYLAIAFFAIDYAQFNADAQMNPAFEIMMARDDLAIVDDVGRNAIHNLVSYKRPRVPERYSGLGCNSIENYTSAIDRLTRIGCDVDHQDKQGRTALHMATQLQNYEAIVALFQCGANTNIIDENKKPALAYALEYGENRNIANKWIFRPYYMHLSMLTTYGFDVSEANVKLYMKARRIFEMNGVIMYPDAKEIEKLKKWQTGVSSMSMYDLLTGEGVAAYTMMNHGDRLVIDGIFQKGCLRKEVPNTTAYLLLRHNQARAELRTRLALIEPAKVSLQSLVLRSCCHVPDVCAHIILGFLTAVDLQNVIDAVSDAESTSANII